MDERVAGWEERLRIPESNTGSGDISLSLLSLWPLHSTSTTAMASSSFPLLSSGPSFVKRACCSPRIISTDRILNFKVHCSALEPGHKPLRKGVYEKLNLLGRRHMIGFILVTSTFGLATADSYGVGLPPEEKPRLCDDECEKELENIPMVTTESGLQYKDIKVGEGPSPPIGFQVAANYVAMVPSGQIFDSSLEKSQPYIFRVGAGQVVKGLDEGILSMKVGGKRRLYIPGPLAFPKGLSSAPGRPRVAPNSPVIFDVSLEYVPGLDDK